MPMCSRTMGIRKLALWLLIIGVLSLIIGGVIGVLTIDPVEFIAQFG
jgi:hypothetical protein